jgi:hypothetical protein
MFFELLSTFIFIFFPALALATQKTLSRHEHQEAYHQSLCLKYLFFYNTLSYFYRSTYLAASLRRLPNEFIMAS